VANMLKEYKGSMLLVSHDEEFMQNVGLDKMILLPGGETIYL